MEAIGQVLFTQVGRRRRWICLVFSPRRGSQKSAKGTASRRQPQSDALGTVSKQPGSPERAKQIGSSHTLFVRCSQGLFRPFRAGVFHPLLTQGGATRLRRSALPWAALWLPLRGESPGITMRSPSWAVMLRSFGEECETTVGLATIPIPLSIPTLHHPSPILGKVRGTQLVG